MPEFRAALRDAFETMGRITLSHGVLNWTKDHQLSTNETGGMLKVTCDRRRLRSSSH